MEAYFRADASSALFDLPIARRVSVTALAGERMAVANYGPISGPVQRATIG
jgi:hypothetical protein